MLLIAGASTRAAAESAARAGFAVTALDAYADLDQHPGVHAVAIPSTAGHVADALARAARDIDAEAVAYLSPFENHPDALTALTRGRRLLGNDVDVLRRVRDPLVVQQTFAERGFVVARVIVDPRTFGSTFALPPSPSGLRRTGRATADRPSDPRALGRWLVKPIRSGGGHAIRRADVNRALQPGWYLQEQLDGCPGSITFVASHGRCTVLAVSRQLVGEAAFGAEGYRYCGSLIAWDDEPETAASIPTGARALADAATEAFDLVGVNGIDFIMRDDVLVPIEINPRWSSSMELVDRRCRIPVMKAHIDACAGSLVDDVIVKSPMPVSGKAIVFARRDVVMPDTTTWLGDPDVRDVPTPHQRIARGQPICTVFAEGATEEACQDALVRRAADIYALTEKPAPA